MMDPGRIKIMLGGKVIAEPESIHLAITDDTEPSTKELTDPWRTPCIEHEFDISGSAIVHEHSQDLLNRARDIMNGKWDVMIQRQIGHMPRKMKKAKHANYRRATKWKRKLAAHILRRSFVLRNAELVLSISRQKMLQAMISGGRIDHCCDISAEELQRKIQEGK